MMGARLEDPEGIEGNIPAVPGLGLLPQCTVIEQEKVTKQSRFTFRSGSPMACKGYEIHMGTDCPFRKCSRKPGRFARRRQERRLLSERPLLGQLYARHPRQPGSTRQPRRRFQQGNRFRPIRLCGIQRRTVRQISRTGQETCGYGVYL